jgi:hypothetical protein
MKREREYKFAIVDWVDAWLSDTLERDTTCLRHSAGWLVQNNSKVVRLALTVDGRGPGDVMNIPRSLVRSVEILLVETRPEGPEDVVEPSPEDLAEAEAGY